MNTNEKLKYLIQDAYNSCMKTMGYVLVARDGALYKNYADGTSEFVKEITKPTKVDKSKIINLKDEK